jgi:uncharacterized protein YkwD
MTLGTAAPRPLDGFRPRDLPAGLRLVTRPRRLAAMLTIAFATTTVGLLGVPRTALAWDASTFSSASEQQMIRMTNQARASAGLRTLKVDATLTSVARWRSKDMIVRNYFSHTIPGSGNVFHVLDTKGYCYKLAGENIAWNTYPDDVATATAQNGFMNSPGHRENILGKTWDVIGVGAYKGPDGKKMWTVLFADRCGSTTPPKPKPKPTPKPRPRPVVAKPTPRPTPRPTTKPRPTATPTPTPTPTSTVPAGVARRPEAVASDAPEPAASPTPAATGATVFGQIRDAAPGAPEAVVRVVDPVGSSELIDRVVTDVTAGVLGP